MNTWNVILTDYAQADIQNIYRYIAFELKAPKIAQKQVKHILDTAHSLKTFPLRYPLYEKEPWQAKGLRKVPIGNYLLFYIPIEAKKEVVIYRIFYGSRNIQSLLENLK